MAASGGTTACRDSSGGPESGLEARACVRRKRAMAILAMPEQGQDARGTKADARKNAGPSGDIVENKGRRKSGVGR